MPVVYLDLRKAFDRVSVPRLLHILSARVGIRGRLWGWLRSFLTGRRIRCAERNEAGDWHSIDYGVPQGAVLSPLLFLCYIHELVQQLHTTAYRPAGFSNLSINSSSVMLSSCVHLSLFADDIALLPNLDCFRLGSVTGPDWSRALQQALDALSAWAADNSMEFNSAKSNVVYHAVDMYALSRRMRWHAKLQPSISGFVLQPADSYTYLGLTISYDLTWTEQFERLLTRARSDAYLVSRLVQSDNNPPFFPAIQTLCSMFIRARCSYAAALWQPTANQLRQLEYQMMRPIMRLLHLPMSTNRCAVLVDSGLPTLQRYRQQLLLRYVTRLAYDSTAHQQQLNPSLLQYNMDVNEEGAAVNSRNWKLSRLSSLAAEAISTAQEWRVPLQLLNPYQPTAALLPLINSNPPAAKQQLIRQLKQTMHQLTIDDMNAVAPRDTNNPTPLRSIVMQPTKPFYLCTEQKPMIVTRARLRLNRAYNNINIDEYRHDTSDAAGLCKHSSCLANQQRETVSHILLDCPHYAADRQELQHRLSTLIPQQPLNLSTALGTLTNALSTATKPADRHSYYQRFLSFSSRFIDSVQSLRAADWNLPSF